MLKIKHIDRYPLAPRADQLDAYNLALETARAATGVQYRTGARFGQQLAIARRTGGAS
jgi:hypothetical protein